jgi:uncharacterized membrane protein
VNPREMPREIRNFGDLRASVTPVMWVRAIFLLMVLAACALVGLAVVLALVLWSMLTAIHGFERLDGGLLITIWQWNIAHSLT